MGVPYSKSTNRRKLNNKFKGKNDKNDRNYKNEMEKITIDSLSSAGLNSPRSIERFLSVTYPYFHDELEAIKMERQNVLYKEMWQGNFCAPVAEILETGGHVLDLGCGPGAYIVDCAKDYPLSTFMGIDISPMFNIIRSPPNVGFMEYNLLEGIPFPNFTFDYVHQRLLALAYTEEQWEDAIEEIVRVCKPGGWIELLEPDFIINNAGPITKLYFDEFRSCMNSRGINTCMASRLPKLLETTNQISEIFVLEKQLPIGNYDLEFGAEGAITVIDVINSTRTIMKDLLKLNDDEYSEMIQNIAAEARCPQYKMSMNFIRIYGMKTKTSLSNYSDSSSESYIHIL
ncbi:6502_t:CDS:2 [Diversispora eburnea]|uniref:6502_t:CDS:1 n=1 Tax=Diversispora eburnea TaxID=1213867 RepID=A0A9N9F593_9GLOM|nr:6502_t:CDS:2 [Diversispora eburnea]